MRTAFLSSIAALAVSFALPALAQEKTLTVYTYESFVAEWGPGPKVKEEFEKTCGCKVEWVGVADGVELLTRLKLEGEGTKADLVLGLDTNLITEAKATGLFEPHGLSPEGLTVPGGFSDDTFLPYDYGHFAVVYDSETLKTPPASLKELVEGDASQKIVIEDPRTSTPGLGLLLWVKSVYGDKSAEAWEKLKDRVLTVTPGWSEAYGLFTKGEAPMVLSYTTSPAYHVIAEKSERYKAAAFSEGHYIQIEVAGLTRTSDDKDLARQFLTFMTGPDFQSIIPETNWMMPAAKTRDPLPAAFGALVKPEKTFLMSSDEVAANRKAWIDEWLGAMSAK
ncbi:thiamine ABC transporter substrate binding subunit [Shinella zoogloeoides]|uniref:thiamine ABC transporter substrate binding subunit n=1 Tax=Shinella zoogloeoides TaxID=352475 RepID=UPI00273F2866|nr:thiamine ABC transporter substrate binding subunit [Shinella zoogloeoides]WLR92295.1 thiamine ABC transporter substrate binding subunit [Shinella zoogloeoides]